MPHDTRLAVQHLVIDRPGSDGSTTRQVVRTVFTFGPVLDQTTGQPTGTAIAAGTTTQVHDGEQFTLTVAPVDPDGEPVAAALEWSVDNGDVAALTVSPDTLTCTVVAGVPGSAVITATDGTLTATEALDVIAGPVSAR